jgi:aspartyl-tRNA(Asn)/glutamyl-tRNA(Gln) amidotransferase subunit A
LTGARGAAPRDPVAAVEASLAAIARHDDRLRACIHVRAAPARTEARALAAAGPAGRPLYGWTVAVKDNTDVAGTVRTDGLPGPHPPAATRDAEAVRRLRAAGAIVVAKANLEELSFAATTQNRTWGRCRNPWDPERIPGGSSGGSAVAVASGFTDLALGTDTGGSIRNPASLCGITGLRPSHGAVPSAGVTPLSPDFDVVGPLARSAAELRVAFAALAGAPPPEPVPAGGLAGVRVGVPDAFFFDDLDPAVAAGVDGLLGALRAAGAILRPVALPGAERTPPALAVLLNGSAARIHRAALDDPRVDEQIKERLRLGVACSAADRDGARVVSDRWRATLAAAFAQVDVLVVPATPAPAPLIGGGSMVVVSRGVNRNNAAWSLAGVPALALPCAPGPQGLPVGAQLVAPAGSDAALLTYGAVLQAGTDWHRARPILG